MYVGRSATLDHRTWCAAAALIVPPGAAIARLSAAYLFGVDLLPRDGPVTVALPRDSRLRPHPRLTVIRGALPATDVTRFAGVPVTTPLRTAFDLGRRPPFTGALVAVDALLNRRALKLVDLEGLWMERRRWPGSRQLARVIALAEPNTESPMETRLRLVLLEAGLPRPVAQFEVFDALGLFVGRTDLAYPERRLALEYEGDHHRAPEQFRRDLARANTLRAAGWTVLHFTADDVLVHPERVVAQVVAVLRAR